MEDIKISKPAFFTPISIIPEFNLDVKANLLPYSALSALYIDITGTKYIQLSVNESLLQEEIPDTTKVKFWILWLGNYESLVQNNILFTLPNKSINVICDLPVKLGVCVILWSLFNADDVQISTFNKKYVNIDSGGKEVDYFEQLFYCNYSFPASWILERGYTGFCGVFFELFSGFIQLKQQGII